MSLMESLLSCFCLLVVTLYLQYRWRHRRVLEAASKLPCPPTLPLLGNIHLLVGGLAKTMKLLVKWSFEYNGLYCIWIGPSPTFVVGNTEDAKVILQSSSKIEKGRQYRHLRKYIKEGLITAEMDVWKLYRPLINPMFRQSNLEQLVTLFHDCGESIIKEIEKSSGNGPINLIDMLFDCLLDNSLGLTYGKNSYGVADVKSCFKNLFKWAGAEAWIREMNPIYSLDCVFYLFYWRKLKQAQRWCTTINNKIDEALAEIKKTQGVNISKDWISLLDVWNEVSSGKFEDRHWDDEIFTLISASSDTTVAAVSFMLMSLATNQEVQEKVYCEIKQMMGSRKRDLSMSDLNSLTYLGHAITETIRLHCIIPLIPRKSTKEIKLRDFTIPAGSQLLISFDAMGKNPKTFHEPQTFNPDRFVSGGSKDENDLSSKFLPFSWGPRICIGKTYVNLLIKVIIVDILCKYKLATNGKLEDIEYNLEMVNYARNPLPIDFIPR